MDPEVVLVLLVFLTAAPAAMLAGCLHNSRPLTFVSPRDMERACWKKVWIPLLPGVAIACLMGGWAIAEPVPADEPVPPLAVLIASPFALVWCRALIRAITSWISPATEDPLAATVGLFRPTILLSPVLRGALDADAFAAVRAHEVTRRITILCGSGLPNLPLTSSGPFQRRNGACVIGGERSRWRATRKSGNRRNEGWRSARGRPAQCPCLKGRHGCLDLPPVSSSSSCDPGHFTRALARLAGRGRAACVQAT